ncbi:MAG: hypothetical protein WCI68_04520 [Actinomycetes bacterium]
MRSNLINNYRMGGYLLLAVGLINLRYQTGQSDVLKNSLLIVVPGAGLLAATWIPGIAKLLLGKVSQIVVAALGILLVVYAIIN